MKSKSWWWICVFLWCGMIFFQSSKPSNESQKESLFLVTVINRWVSAIAGREVAIVSDGMVRKSAHGFEYLVLGVLLFNGFLSGNAIRKALALSLCAGFAYAVSDEFHQYFVPGRSMRALDIMVDTIGLLCGTGLVYLRARRRLLRKLPSTTDSRFKLIIFDFDGTLADTLPWFTVAINIVADRYHFRKVTSADLEKYRGCDAGFLLKNHGIPAWKIPMIANHMRSLMARSINQISLFSGIEGVLNRLSASGVLMAVVSSNSRGNILRLLGRSAAQIRLFECGVSLSGKESKIKKVLRKTGTLPGEALLIGDEIRDALAAQKSNVAFGAVSWGYNSIESLRKLSPAVVFETVDDITLKTI